MPGSRRRRRPHGLTQDAFSPKTIAGLILWWEADEVYTSTTFTPENKVEMHEDPVAVFWDKSENENHGILVAGTGDSPELQVDPGYLGTSVRCINRSYAAENVTGLAGKNTYTVITVRRVYNGGGSGTFGSDQWFDIVNSSNTNVHYMSKDVSAARINSGTIASTSGSSSFGAIPPSPSLIVEVYTFDGSKAAAQRLGYRYGSAERLPLTSPAPTGSPFDSIPGDVHIRMGALRRTSGTTDLDFHALLVYDRLLNEGEIALIISSLYSNRGYVAVELTSASPPFLIEAMAGKKQRTYDDTAMNYGMDTGLCAPGLLGLHVTVGVGVNSISPPSADGWTAIGRTGAFVPVKVYIDMNYCTVRRYEGSPPHVMIGTVPVAQNGPASGKLFSQPIRMWQPLGTLGGGVNASAGSGTADRTIPTFTCVQPGRLIVLVATFPANEGAFTEALGLKFISKINSIVIDPVEGDAGSYALYTYTKVCAKDEVIPAIVVPSVEGAFSVQTLFFYC